ncbi:MAG: protein kinase [Phycisphaerales bacterium]|nr:protein kinase [Phycisphaerales bacterium]
MTPEQLGRLESLFDAACRLPEPQRRDFARQNCAADTTLRENLLALIDADRTRHTPLDNPVLTPERVAAAVAGESHMPPTIGKYRLIRQLGEGGMGIVYEAEQENPRRRVAIKLLRPAAANPDAIRRFQREAELLARLHHPGIAQVFEAGLTQMELRNAPLDAARRGNAGSGSVAHATELPYLVMEYIDGQTLLKFCESNGLPPRERVALMANVCDAVQHAHQRGIIHRDLKPGNILVIDSRRDTGQSNGPALVPAAAMLESAHSRAFALSPFRSGHQTKVLDFGVARVLEFDAVRTARTLTGQIVGTLPYMSPEQFAGEPDEIDTRSDVYALGVILYELLCGRLPHAATNPLELARKIREDDPPRPSAIRSTVRGDLETIILKALQKEPARRYQTAAELRDDLSRYLLNEPIEARRTSGLYILRKTLMRYRFAALMLAGFVLLTTVSSIALGVLYGRAEREKRASEARAEALRRSNYFNTVALAQSNLRDGNSAQALRMLNESPTDLRDWEWRYLLAQCDTSVRVISSHTDTGALRFAPCDLRLATLAYDRALRLWDPLADRPIAEFATGSMAETIDFSPDGRRAVVGTRYPFAQVFSFDPPRVVRLAAHEGNVWTNRVAWSPCGNLLASVAQVQVAQIYDGQSLELVDRVRSARTLACLDFLPAGDMIAFGTHAGFVEIWSADRPQLIRQWPAHRDAISSLRCSPDGRLIVTRSADNQIRVWSAADATLLHTIPCSSSGAWLAVSPDSRRVVAGVDLTLREWSLESGEALGDRLGHAAQITDVSYSPDGQWLASIDRDGVARVWSAEYGSSPRVFDQSGKIVLSASIDRDAKLLWTTSSNGWLIARTLPEGNELYVTRPQAGEALRGALAPNGEIGLVGADNGALEAVEPLTGAPLAQLHVGGTRVRSIAISSDSRRAAVIRESGGLAVFDLTTLTLERSFTAFEEQGYGVDFLPDNRTLVACGGDGSVSLFDANTGRQIRRLGEHENRAYVVAASPDGRMVASAGLDRTIRIWAVDGLKAPLIIRGHAGGIRALRFTRSGRRLLSGGSGDLMYLWDVESGSQVIAINAHARAVESIVASADGQMIVTGGGDSAAKLWHGTMPTAQTAPLPPR